MLGAMARMHRPLLFWTFVVLVGCGSANYAYVGGADGSAPDDGSSSGPDGSTGSDGGSDASSDGSGDEPLVTDGSTDAARSYSETVMDDKPIGYWRFEGADGGVVGDVSGRGYPMQLSAKGATLASDTPLTAKGMALVLDGDAGYAQAVGTGDLYNFLNRASYSLEAWVKPASLSFNNARIFSRDDVDNGYEVYVTEGDAGLGFIRWYSVNTDSSEQPAAMPIGQFTHVVATYDGTRMRVYANGVLQSDSPSTANNTNVLDRLTIGALAYDQASYDDFHGVIDEAAVYDKALAADRIKAHFDAAKH